MLASIQHRGPDAQRYWFGQGVAFGHARLAIIDLSEEANQPFRDFETGAVLAFNGELYNYVELRAELIKAGHQFRTLSDTEVLLRALLAWGVDALRRLVGMFAFAFHDPRDGTVILARDPFGIKPLYWLEDQGRLLVASEPLALIRAVPGAAQMDRAAAAHFLATGLVDLDERTFFAAIRRLPAATCWTIQIGHPLSDATRRRYWKPPTEPNSGRRRSWGEMVEEVREALTDSVRLHLRSDVPIASCLSGGIDSSSLVSIAAKLQPPNVPALTAYSAVFPGQSIDEARYARAVVNHTKSRWITVTPTADSLSADLDVLLKCQQEPFASPGVYLQWQLFQRIAGDGIKVVLDGQGADEYLAGYTSFLIPSIIDLVNAGRYGDAAATLNVLIREKSLSKLMLRDLRGALVRVFAQKTSVAGAKWLAPEMLSALQEIPSERTFAASHLRRVGLTYLQRHSLPALLRYEDRNSMSFSIESRVPFLDHRLVETVLRLPDEALLQRGRTKAVLRDAMRGIVPDIVLDRRDKLGFASPIGRWVSELVVPELKKQLGADGRLESFVSPSVVKRWLANRKTDDHDGQSERLWRLYILLRWQEKLKIQF